MPRMKANWRLFSVTGETVVIWVLNPSGWLRMQIGALLPTRRSSGLRGSMRDLPSRVQATGETPGPFALER